MRRPAREPGHVLRAVLAALVLAAAPHEAGSQLPAGVDAAEAAGLYEDGKPSLAPLLRDVVPAVVNISVTTNARMSRNPLLEDPFFRRFFELPVPRERVPRQSVGSGVIIDAEAGHVLTNNHVIEQADAVSVTLADGRRFDAELIGTDPATDIALLGIDADGLTALPLGDSEALDVGDFVLAVGNPFGLGQTVTSGIVSALGRSGLNVEGYENFIQTDASINPGNSGGALVDLDGELVGINTAIVAPSGGNVGIGFAVPAAMARRVAEQLIEHGEVRRGRLGVRARNVTPEIADALGIDLTDGALLTQVAPGLPAARAGLEPGDIVVEVAGQPVTSSTELRNEIGLARAGSSVGIAFVRDGRRRDATVELTDPRAAASRAADEPGRRLDGARFGPIGPEHPRYGQVEGVLVENVEAGTRAARSGLRAGDIVLAVNRSRVRSVEELRRAVDAAAGTSLALNVLRGSARLFIVIR